MQQTTTDCAEIMLHGEWTMNEAADRLKFLDGELARLLEAQPKPSGAVIDLAGVTEVDACGCQLLAVFLVELKSRAIAPQPRCIPPHVLDKIRLLGFGDGFADGDGPEKEDA